MWYQPGPTFGYTIQKIEEHPWNTLLTMKELLQLEPGTIQFVGTQAKEHEQYWKERHPTFFGEKRKSPVFVVDTTPIHPHRVETKPRKPFQPWSSV